VRRYIALLRALNVGGHTVAMARLRSLFVDLGFQDVQTLIASGNVIFEASGRNAAALERRIAQHLETSLGYPVPTFLRTPAELGAVIEHRPFPAALSAPGARLFIAFLGAVPSPQATRNVLGLRAPTDKLAVAGRELYWLCRVPTTQAAVSGAVLEKTLGMPVTVRNVTTVRKLVARASTA
jgi:uncharacterized protein (DUF1697 family)